MIPQSSVAVRPMADLEQARPIIPLLVTFLSKEPAMVLERLKNLPARRRANVVPRSYEDYVPTSPFAAIRRMQEDMGQLMETLWPQTESAWYPAVDVTEEGEELVVKADLPGVDPDDIDLRITEDTLGISAETKYEEEKREKGFYLAERRYGSFQRVIPLPASVKSDDVTARFDNGVLEVRLPKAKEARRIPIASRGGQRRPKDNGQSDRP